MVNWGQASKLLQASFIIAFIIFFTALSSDFSVKMFYSSTDPYIQIFFGLFAILLIGLLFALLLWMMPPLKRALIRAFGIGR